MKLEDKELQEINFWRDDPNQNPSEFTRGNILNKMQEAKHFNYKLSKYRKLFRQKKNVLELGAGQGWASCFMKKFFLKNANFTVTDISKYAIASLKYWEKLFEVEIINRLACKSYEIPLRDASFDFIFCYASAHHFVKIKETLIELNRLLEPGGHIIFMYEPTCSKLLYPLHYRYANKESYGVPEDVLVPSEIKKIAEPIGLKFKNDYDPHQTIIRSISIELYFKMLKTLPFLQKVLPSSSDLVFVKT